MAAKRVQKSRAQQLINNLLAQKLVAKEKHGVYALVGDDIF